MKLVRNFNSRFGDEVIPITSYALSKLMAIARIMEHCEARVILLGKKGENARIIQDMYVPFQEVTGADASHIEDQIAKDYDKMYTQGWAILGIAHSHGLNGIRPSSIDDGSIDKILKLSWSHNMLREYAGATLALPPKEDEGTLVLRGFDRFTTEVRIDKKSIRNWTPELGEDLRNAISAVISKRIRGEVYSLIVDHNCSEIYGLKRIIERVNFLYPQERMQFDELMHDRRYQFTRDGENVIYTVPTVVVNADGDGDHCKINIAELVDDLHRKIIVRAHRKPAAFEDIERRQREIIERVERMRREYNCLEVSSADGEKGMLYMKKKDAARREDEGLEREIARVREIHKLGKRFSRIGEYDSRLAYRLMSGTQRQVLLLGSGMGTKEERHPKSTRTRHSRGDGLDTESTLYTMTHPLREGDDTLGYYTAKVDECTTYHDMKATYGEIEGVVKAMRTAQSSNKQLLERLETAMETLRDKMESGRKRFIQEYEERIRDLYFKGEASIAQKRKAEARRIHDEIVANGRLLDEDFGKSLHENVKKLLRRLEFFYEPPKMHVGTYDK